VTRKYRESKVFKVRPRPQGIQGEKGRYAVNTGATGSTGEPGIQVFRESKEKLVTKGILRW